MISAGTIGGGQVAGAPAAGAAPAAPAPDAVFSQPQVEQLQKIVAAAVADQKPTPGVQTAAGDAVTLSEGPKIPDLDPSKDATLIGEFHEAQLSTEEGKGRFLNGLGAKAEAEAENINKPWYRDPNSLNAITNLGSQIFAWKTSVRFFQMQEHFADNKLERDTHISDNEVLMQSRAADAAERLQPEAVRLQKEVAQIREDGETERYNRRLESRERERSLDRVFNSRSDYPNYGNPFAA